MPDSLLHKCCHAVQVPTSAGRDSHSVVLDWMSVTSSVVPRPMPGARTCTQASHSTIHAKAFCGSCQSALLGCNVACPATCVHHADAHQCVHVRHAAGQLVYGDQAMIVSTAAACAPGSAGYNRTHLPASARTLAFQGRGPGCIVMHCMEQGPYLAKERPVAAQLPAIQHQQQHRQASN